VGKSRNALGKGLGALIRSAPEEEEVVSVIPSDETKDDGKSTGVLAHIEVKKVTPNPYQPRKEFDRQALEELAQSIKEKGLVQPITVRRFEKGFQLISGERRVRACKIAGVQHMPAYILNIETIEDMIELSLIENIQREQLNPIEIAHSYRQLSEECNHSQEVIAQKVGKDRSTVANTMRLLKLPGEIQESIQKNELSMGHARALININNNALQLSIWRRIIMDGLSVRKVEKLVKEETSPTTQKTKAPRSSAKKGNFVAPEIAEKLQRKFGTRINISASKDGNGSIVFEYYSHDDFDRIIDLFLSESVDY
jgi:ParB family transcriptional regulator, chromosome partitioning protein